MRLIFLGDVVGKAGRDAVYQELPRMRERHSPVVGGGKGEKDAHAMGRGPEIRQRGLDGGGAGCGAVRVRRWGGALQGVGVCCPCVRASGRAGRAELRDVLVRAASGG